MRITKLAKNKALHAVCEQCNLRAKNGQWVAYKYLELKQGAAFKDVFLLHVKCMAVLVERSGSDDDDDAVNKRYDARRRKIKETGDLFSE